MSFGQGTTGTTGSFMNVSDPLGSPFYNPGTQASPLNVNPNNSSLVPSGPAQSNFPYNYGGSPGTNFAAEGTPLDQMQQSDGFSAQNYSTGGQDAIPATAPGSALSANASMMIVLFLGAMVAYEVVVRKK